MIQRIQTIFLLMAFVLTGSLFFTGFAELVSVDIYSVSLKGITSSKQPSPDLQSQYWLTILGLASAILILTIIFLYKNRKLQMNLCLLAILLLVALNVAMFLILDHFQAILAAEVKYKLYFIFPLITAILVFMAYKSIQKDDRLIKSLDRLR